MEQERTNRISNISSITLGYPSFHHHPQIQIQIRTYTEMIIVVTTLTTTLLNYYLVPILYHLLNKKVPLVLPPLIERYLATLVGLTQVIRQLRIDKVEWKEPIPLVLP